MASLIRDLLGCFVSAGCGSVGSAEDKPWLLLMELSRRNESPWANFILSCIERLQQVVRAAEWWKSNFER